MPLQVGQALENRYEIVRVVKRGGMGAVYEARDLRLGGNCAVKEMLECFEGPDVALIRDKFEVEMTLLARLNHPGIPSVRDFFVHGPTCYLVMDFIEGESLDQELQDYLLHTRKAFPVSRLVKDVCQLLGILDYLHGLEPPVIHRDIKPANLIRDRRTGRICLVDFGLARTYSLGAHTAVGTLGYAPQEQLGGRAEPRSDLYAVGVMMRELLSGQAPNALVISSVRTLLPDLDPALTDLIDRATAFKAQERFPSARAMFEAIHAWEGCPGLDAEVARDQTRAVLQPSGPIRVLDLLIALSQSACLALLKWKSRLESRAHPVLTRPIVLSRAATACLMFLSVALLMGWSAAAGEKPVAQVSASGRVSHHVVTPEVPQVDERPPELPAPKPVSRAAPARSEELRLEAPAGLRLVGTMQSGSGMTAVVSRDGAYHTVRKGQSWDGYRVRSIAQGEVVLSRSGVHYLLKI